jgi:hypothetical protein
MAENPKITPPAVYTLLLWISAFLFGAIAVPFTADDAPVPQSRLIKADTIMINPPYSSPAIREVQWRSGSNYKDLNWKKMRLSQAPGTLDQ